MPVSSAAKKYAAAVIRALARAYPDATCSLVHDTPLELLVATILSAQCTDERVNIVTKDLFKTYRSAAAFARVPIHDLEKAIQSTGFFRSKAKSIQGAAKILVERHGGEVPQDFEALLELPGVGRKTASVVLGTAFGIPSGIVVDTHVLRLSVRLGLASKKNAEKVELELMAIVPQKDWIIFSHRLIQHGRKICNARKPKCDECMLNKICPRIGVE